MPSLLQSHIFGANLFRILSHWLCVCMWCVYMMACFFISAECAPICTLEGLKLKSFQFFFPFHSFICKWKKHIFRWCALPVWRRMLSILECLPLLLLFFGFCFALLCVYICVPQNASFATTSRCDFICDCDTWTLPIFMYFVQF